MSTFHEFLMDQEKRDDQVGEVARWWAGDAARRPRSHSPSGIQKWMDRELREGGLSGIEDAEKGRMREAFAATVREYHERTTPAMDGMIGRADAQEIREMLRMVRVQLDRILAHLGLDTAAYGLQTPNGPIEVRVSPHVPDGAMVITSPIPAGRREAVEIRARMGDPAAQAELAAHQAVVTNVAGDGAAGLPADGPQIAAEPVPAVPAHDDDAQAVLDALSTLAGMVLVPDGDAWQIMLLLADHDAAQTLEGTPDDYAA